jgi:signal transduction histidine kinase
MTPFPVPHRWLATLLGVALLLDTTIVLGSHPWRTVLSIPSAALFAACAWVGMRRPAVGATLGTVALIASSALMRFADVVAPSIVLSHITLTEVISGVVLVVMVVWRTAPVVSVPAVAGLVASCLISIAIRSMSCDNAFCDRSGTFVTLFSPSNLFMTAVIGFLLLAGSVGTGVYLRHSAMQRVETEMGALVRKQWPLGAALAVLALLELSDRGVNEIIGLVAAVIVGALAFFGPKYPLRNALLAAGVLVFAGVLERFGGVLSDWPFSPTASAACMALIAYVVRYVQPRKAVWGTATLTVALGIFMTARGDSTLDRDDGLFLLILLLLIAVATGWYFRARDRERNQTVKAAVTSAQQGERMALARELHDVVAHHVTGIVVQAQAALMVAGNNPDVALPALERIERSGTEALTAMRTLVGSLREGTAAWTAAYADATGDATTDLAADLSSVVENFTGPPVEVELKLPADLPHEMGRSVLRLVQESLTNVGKHAPDASVVRVRVATVDDTLHIRVSDDGMKRPANPAGGSGGYGLVGMRERVELLGGRFEAGPSGYVGWNVEAWLPLRKEGS